MGSVIPGTKFIAFKVPLKKELCQDLSEDERFSPSKLIDAVASSGKTLGLVVDLTFTRKYYNGKEFTNQSIQYEKIFTQGHEVPSEEVFSRFGKIVDTFCEETKDRDFLIGVHCTHGVNRTGYLVCRYMIERLNISPDEAIALFSEARGHPLERETYIKDLKMRPLQSIPEAPLPVDLHRPAEQDRHQRPKQSKPGPDRSSYRSRHNCRHEEYSVQHGRHNRQFREDVQDNRKYSAGHAERWQSPHSHVSPLERLEGPPESSWGSAAGWRGGGRGGWGNEDRGGWGSGARGGWGSGARGGWGSGARGGWESRGRGGWGRGAGEFSGSHRGQHHAGRGCGRHGDSEIRDFHTAPDRSDPQGGDPHRSHSHRTQTDHRQNKRRQRDGDHRHQGGSQLSTYS